MSVLSLLVLPTPPSFGTPLGLSSLCSRSLAVGFLLWGYAIGVTSNLRHGIMKCGSTASCLLMFYMYYVCMYVCILLLLPRGSDGMLWGKGGVNLREGKCFNFSSDLVASPSSALSYGTLKVFHMAHLGISRITMRWFQWEFRKESEDSEMVQCSSPRSSQLTSPEHMELAWERV